MHTHKHPFRTLALLAAIPLIVALSGCGKPQSGQASTQAQAAHLPPPPVVAVAKANPENGKALFGGTCSACHGPDAKGLPHLGKDLTTSAFIKVKSDEELLDFVKHGRGPTDPGNTTGVAMPPKGGNPALDDAKLRDIISYVRTLSH